MKCIWAPPLEQVQQYGDSNMAMQLKYTTEKSLISTLDCHIHVYIYEAKDDATGVSFEKNGVKEWVPIVVTKKGKELSVKELERSKRIVYFQNENGPHFSIRKGNCQFPTPIARRTCSRIKPETS